MKNAIIRLSLIGLLGGVAAPAHAATFPAGFGGTYCGGDNFITCAWFSASIDANNLVTLKVKNTSGNAGSFFTAIGLSNLGTGATASNFSYANQGSTTSNWTLGAPPSGLSGAGITGVTIGAYRVSPPSPSNTLNDGEEAWFTFTLGGTFNLNNVQFAVHDQGGSTEYSCSTSTKLVVSQTSPTSGTWAANETPSDCLPPTVVPEPGTIALLATGLVGLAGAGAIRRRKESV